MPAMSKQNKTIPGDETPGRRERLLTEASRIFALKGFDKASTREIAQAAGANIGLIAYYFGDKLGLYREVMMRPVADVIARMPEADASVPLREWLESFYGAFLQPLQLDEEALASLLRLCGARNDRTLGGLPGHLCGVHRAAPSGIGADAGPALRCGGG